MILMVRSHTSVCNFGQAVGEGRVGGRTEAGRNWGEIYGRAETAERYRVAVQ